MKSTTSRRRKLILRLASIVAAAVMLVAISWLTGAWMWAASAVVAGVTLILVIRWWLYRPRTTIAPAPLSEDSVSTSGRYVVLGAPGSGKTQLLVSIIRFLHSKSARRSASFRGRYANNMIG